MALEGPRTTVVFRAILSNHRSMNGLGNTAIENSPKTEKPMKAYFNNLIRSVFKEESGTAAVEYAIMIALILVMCIAALLSTGDFQRAIWDNSNTKIQSIIPTN